LLFDLYYIPSNRIEHWHISWYHYSLDYISGVNLSVYLYGSRYIWSSIIPLICEWKKEYYPDCSSLKKEGSNIEEYISISTWYILSKWWLTG